jgi:hypothetical protein
MARAFPIIGLKSCICSLFSIFSSLNPFKGTIAFDYIGYSGVIRIGSKLFLYHVECIFFCHPERSRGIWSQSILGIQLQPDFSTLVEMTECLFPL